MKILIVTARYYPEQFSINNISENLVKNGHEVVILTGRPHYGYGQVIRDHDNTYSETANGIKIYRIKEKIRKKSIISLFLNYFSIYKQYNKFLKKHKENYDIVLSHVMSPIFTMRGIRKFCLKINTPHVHYGLDLWPESLVATYYFSEKSLIFKLIKRYSRKLYSTCDIISFSSPSAKDYFSDYLSLPNIPFYHIYQPVLSEPPILEKLSQFKFRSTNKIKILYCGTIAKFHRIDIFIEALKLFPNKNKIEFHLVGSGSEVETIKKLVEKYDLTNIVFFHGRVSVNETVHHFMSTDVLFVPLIKNSQTSYLIPQKVIEYFMYAKPIFGMLVGDGADLIHKASKHNIICDQTPDSLIKGLTEIERYSDELLKKCGKENRDFFDSEPRFQLETVCNELEHIMNEAIKIKK